MIELKNVKKYFKKPVRGKGVWGMLKTLFSRKYTTVKAVDGVSFDIADGEAVGYIGANGAGKSTTIKMMSGILTPTEGDVFIDGLRPYVNRERKSVLKSIGVVFGQKTQLWLDLPLTETYELLKGIYDIPSAEYERRLGELIELLDMKPFISAPVRTLSLGQRMRADLAAAMLHNPKTLFLDEPTIGLDVLVKRNLISAIKSIRAQYNTTLLLTTHAMSDIEQLCERVIVLDSGKTLFDGSIDGIKHMFGDKRNITVTTKTPVSSDTVNALGGMCDAPPEIAQDGRQVRFAVDAGKLHVNEFLQSVFAALPVDDVKIAETDIEQVVRTIYEDGIAPPPAENGENGEAACESESDAPADGEERKSAATEGDDETD